jgi:hypothetical protein
LLDRLERPSHAETMVKSQRTPEMTVGRAALIGLMRRYLAAVMDPAVTLLEIHKLLYFMQEAGQNLRLQFQKGPFGPYARNLRHVLSHIEGHFIQGYGDAEDRPHKQIELLPGSLDQAERFLDDHPDTRERFQRVVGLIRPHHHDLPAPVAAVGPRRVHRERDRFQTRLRRVAPALCDQSVDEVAEPGPPGREPWERDCPVRATINCGPSTPA